MRALITGANGFVGRAVCARLNADGYEVVGAVRHPSALVELGPVIGIAVGEIDGNTDWKMALEGVQVVVHAAGRAHKMRETRAERLAAHHRVNVDGTVNLARQAAAKGVRRLVFLSSIKVNGEHTLPGRPFTAQDVPAPQDAYSISKWEAEQALSVLATETGMEVVVVRPPLIYGPGVKGNFRMLMRALAAGLLLPLGAIDNRRSLVALENVVDLVAALIKHPLAANRVFLVSDGEDISISNLLRRLGRALEKPVRLLPVPVGLLIGVAALLGRRAMANRLCGNLQVDMSATQALLEWKPRIGTDDGLRRTAVEFLETKPK